MTEFRDIPLPGRIIIVAVAGGVFAVAGVAVATSYNAVYRLVSDLGLYGEAINKTFGSMVDVAFIVAELAAILGGILRAMHLRTLPPDLPERDVKRQARQVSRGWPANVMLVCGAATVAFNVFHAYLLGGAGDPKTPWRCVVAAFPPVLMILSFQVLIALVKWVMLTIGRPLQAPAPPLLPEAVAELPEAVRSRLARLGVFAGQPLPEKPHNGQLSVGGSNGSDVDEVRKTPLVRAYLASLGPEAVRVMPASEIHANLLRSGLSVSLKTVEAVLREDYPERATSRNGAAATKATRKPSRKATSR